MTFFVAFLFFILTPGVLIVLPPNMTGPNASYIVTATHALIFAVVYYFTKKMVWNLFYDKTNEGFAVNTPVQKLVDGSSCIKNESCSSNNCVKTSGVCLNTSGVSQNPSKNCLKPEDCSTGFKCMGISGTCNKK